MEKIKILFLAMATGCLLFACESRKQESGSATGSNTGRVDNEDKDDAVEVAKEANDENFESNAAKDHSEFLVEASASGMFELEAAKIAQQRATNPQVKNFAKHMIEEHSKANKELKALAAKKNVTLPASIGEDKQEKVQKLSKYSGTEFDREYMDMMVSAHKEDVRKFNNQSKGTDDTEVEKWAAKTLPNLQKHLEKAQQLNDEVERTDNNSARK